MRVKTCIKDSVRPQACPELEHTTQRGLQMSGAQSQYQGLRKDRSGLHSKGDKKAGRSPSNISFEASRIQPSLLSSTWGGTKIIKIRPTTVNFIWQVPAFLRSSPFSSTASQGVPTLLPGGNSGSRTPT
ncbi:hypothetical protein PoB_006936600 [Plakobranchus ocellatus]|uniref:Uncharacterized protein n=1 Tax=Plakobranchus ocellatus TaxID=259542 RepID=A0AAV4DFA5_9GAST|nr:hypothetical protein PoB_006936600 [Plakobranchus ocellatus]